ncbi:MAG: hypothetical protein LBQ68_07590, partial [Clostridiales bacterium]|nr:hypothetical protein [Clostridiales bacterium]
MRNSLLKRTLILTVTTIIVSCTIAFSSDQKRAVPIYTRLIMNDQLVTDRAYLIDNAVYYKLRTLVLAANFDLKLEDSSNTI